MAISILEWLGLVKVEYVNMFKSEPTAACSNEQERLCSAPWHMDEGIPYCDTCGRYRASVQTNVTPAEAGQWGRQIFEKAKAAVDARRLAEEQRCYDAGWEDMKAAACHLLRWEGRDDLAEMVDAIAKPPSGDR